MHKDTSDRKLHVPNHRFGILFAVVVLVGAYLYYPYTHDGPVLCPFRLTTGLPCPGCGITRALCHISHGEFAESLDYHPVGWLAALLIIGWAVGCAVDMKRKTNYLGRAIERVNRYNRGLATVIGAFWAWRIWEVVASECGIVGALKQSIVVRLFV